MAFDGIVISNLVYELNEKLSGGRITKIAQPEKDELLFTIKNEREQYRLLISASASLPLIYLTESNKPSPMTAPNFCMLLRKHFNSAKLIKITQPGLERIIQFEIEHLNELADVCKKYIIVEMMGKHSNIIFCDESFRIIDSIKHISALVSSVREVLPGRDYFIPKTQEKLDPLSITESEWKTTVFGKPTTIGKAIYTSLTGFSPLMANEICHLASIDAETNTSALTEAESVHLCHTFFRLIEEVKAHNYSPNIVSNNTEPVEFASLPLSIYSNLQVKNYTSISALLEEYYSSKDTITRIRQKSSDLRRVVSTTIERTRRKLDLQVKQLNDTDKRDKYKVYGELLTTYGYQATPGSKEITCDNYYTDKPITIPLDPELSALENAKKYYDRYSKLKRTFEALTIQRKDTQDELDHLESISNSLSIALEENDLSQIKKELTDYGYVKKHIAKGKEKQKKITSKPFHYLSSDGYHMYVGKNNFQNDELTFKFAEGKDWWFHAKGMAGSHVVIKGCDEKEMPDRAFEEAGMLAAYYSKGRDMDKVEIDYIQKKHVKKPNNAKPGFVIYHTNYSMTIRPDISPLQELD